MFRQVRTWAAVALAVETAAARQALLASIARWHTAAACTKPLLPTDMMTRSLGAGISKVSELPLTPPRHLLLTLDALSAHCLAAEGDGP